MSFVNKDDQYVKDFLKNATPEQLEYVEEAGKILSYCGIKCLVDFTDDVHLNILTRALVEAKDDDFIKNLRNVKTADEYLKIRVPNNTILRYYIEDGKSNSVEN